jgi:CheY-like chemotaxis protein
MMDRIESHNAKIPALKIIYLVEDDPSICILISRILGKHQYQVVSFENGLDFLSAIQTTNVLPDLIILDISLPAMSGIEILNQLKQNEKLMHLSVVMLTGSQDPNLIKQAYHAGAIDYLLKPILPNVLVERIQSNLTLKIDTEEVYKILNFLHLEENSILNSTGLKEYRKSTMRCFPILYKSIQICALIPGEFRPKAFLGSTREILEANIIIFRKSSLRWNKIWPAKGSSHTPFAPPASADKNSTEEEEDPPAPQPLKKQEWIQISNLLCMSELLENLKQKKFGKIPKPEQVIWKSIYKWSDEKLKCESEIVDWKVKIQQEEANKESA